MDFQSCELDATGAALKAIQCVELTAKGQAVHPRAGDQSFPEIFVTRCTQCKRCTEECPFGAYDEKPDGNTAAQSHPVQAVRYLYGLLS